MLGWIAFLATLSTIVLLHEWGHFVMARRVGVRVERFSLGFGPKILGITRGGTEYALCLFPLGGYVKMAGESMDQGPALHPWEYRARTVGERVSIVLAGPLINYALGFLLFFAIYLIGAPILSTRIGQVIQDYPAARSGLREGDRILAINGKPMEGWEEVTRAIHGGRAPLVLTIERDGATLTQAVEPRLQEATNVLGVKTRIGMIGIVPSEEVITRRYPLPRALVKAADRVWSLTWLTLQALWRIGTGGLSLKESVTGPIGIFYITSSAAALGFLSLLQLTAVLSTSIGFFNLLPMPVLDGGHLAFLLIEKARGKPVSTRAQEGMTQVGFGLLLLLLLVVTYNDVVKFKLVERIFH
jgi:regulator of sigma E protease